MCRVNKIKTVSVCCVPCLESHGERLVAPPVRGEDGAEEVRAVGPDQLAGVVRQDVHHVPGVRSGPEGPRCGHGSGAVYNLTAGEGRGGRREPSCSGRVYGNMHHNSLGQIHLTGLEVQDCFFLSLFFVSPNRDGLGSVQRLCARMERTDTQRKVVFWNRRLKAGGCALDHLHSTSVRNIEVSLSHATKPTQALRQPPAKSSVCLIDLTPD